MTQNFKTSNEFNLGIIEDEVKKNLSKNVLASMQTATIENLDSIRAGSVVFRVPEIVKTKEYNTAGRAADRPNVGIVRVDLNTYRSVQYELETFDMNSISNWDEVHTQVATGVATAIKAELDLVLLKHLYKNSTNVVLPNAYGEKQEQINNTRLKLSLEQTRLSKTMSNTMIGTQGRETIAVLSPEGYTLMLNGLSTVGGDKAIDMKISGEIEGNLINGNAITKHMFVGEDVDTTIFSDIPKDDYSDFSNVFALMWHKEAVAFPVSILEATQATNYNTGNPTFITKYKYGIATIRPHLIKSILLKKLDVPEPKEKTAKVSASSVSGADGGASAS